MGCGKHDGKVQALSVLDATSPVYLKLSGNSTKLAHWDSFRKLKVFAMLKSLTSDDGSVSAIDVIIIVDSECACHQKEYDMVLVVLAIEEVKKKILVELAWKHKLQ
nr:15190_t:CDS:2 [Entrophospora candida]